MSGESDSRHADALKLHLVDGLGVRAIAKRLGMSRKTVRKLVTRVLTRPRASKSMPRTSKMRNFKLQSRAGQQ